MGAGPTGLTLACDQARRGVRFRILDQAPELPHGRLEVYQGAPPGLFPTHADRLNRDLLAFVQDRSAHGDNGRVTTTRPAPSHTTA